MCLVQLFDALGFAFRTAPIGLECCIRNARPCIPVGAHLLCRSPPKEFAATARQLLLAVRSAKDGARPAATNELVRHLRRHPVWKPLALLSKHLFDVLGLALSLEPRPMMTEADSGDEEAEGGRQGTAQWLWRGSYSDRGYAQGWLTCCPSSLKSGSFLFPLAASLNPPYLTFHSGASGRVRVHGKGGVQAVGRGLPVGE